MPKGAKGEKRPADVIGAAITIAKSHRVRLKTRRRPFVCPILSLSHVVCNIENTQAQKKTELEPAFVSRCGQDERHAVVDLRDPRGLTF